ncbi:hypothetical protein AWM70_02255 [Paenibacillus yonginensis]|uniref:Pilus assembly protein TadE n=2 Tax=Paenibacillus yonginensis TaxID=1462996 RepID=A0A1B1MWH9_9BACL|nr:hypothetical protein AWM70_02255 [Paenibacillus yonginensis]
MKRICSKEEGYFTLEASLLLPAVFVAILVLMFLCLYFYQHVLSGQTAAVAAERIAYSWNNSSKESRTGEYKESEYDPLYWRLTDDALLQSIFSGAGTGTETGTTSSKEVQTELPTGSAEPAAALTVRKLQQTGKELPAVFNGRLVYSHQMLKRSIEADLTRELPVSPLNKITGGDWGINVRAVSYILEPAEWIRTIELARYYAARFQSDGGQATSQHEAGEVLRRFAK